MPRVYSSTTQRKIAVEESFRRLLADNKAEAEMMIIKLQRLMQTTGVRNIG
jgi:hypothetical protein